MSDPRIPNEEVNNNIINETETNQSVEPEATSSAPEPVQPVETGDEQDTSIKPEAGEPMEPSEETTSLVKPETTAIEGTSETSIVETITYTEPVKTEEAPKKKNRKLIFIIGGAVLAAIIVAVVLILYFNAPEQRLVKAVKEGDFDTAYTILTEETVKETDKTTEAAEKVAGEITLRFSRADYNFEEAFALLDALEGTPGAAAAEDAAYRIETMLEEEYYDNFRSLEEALEYFVTDVTTPSITDVKEIFDYRSGYRDSDVWSNLIACALEGDAANAARVLKEVENTEDPAYPNPGEDYPTTRYDIGYNLVDYALFSITAESSDETAKINYELQQALVDVILYGNAADDYSGMFQHSNRSSDYQGLSSLDLITGTEGSGKILPVLRSETTYDKEYKIILSNEGYPVLPEDRMPESLDDVEYIVLFYYDKVEGGTYSFSNGSRVIPGYQVFGNVSVIHAPTGKVLYLSDTIWGPELKETYYVYDSTTQIVEDRPDLSVFSDDVLNVIGIDGDSIV